jgi:hypothetical protein
MGAWGVWPMRKEQISVATISLRHSFSMGAWEPMRFEITIPPGRNLIPKPKRP